MNEALSREPSCSRTEVEASSGGPANSRWDPVTPLRLQNHFFACYPHSDSSVQSVRIPNHVLSDSSSVSAKAALLAAISLVSGNTRVV